MKHEVDNNWKLESCTVVFTFNGRKYRAIYFMGQVVETSEIEPTSSFFSAVTVRNCPENGREKAVVSFVIKAAIGGAIRAMEFMRSVLEKVSYVWLGRNLTRFISSDVRFMDRIAETGNYTLAQSKFNEWHESDMRQRAHASE